MRVFNLNEAQFAYDESDPVPYRAGMDRFGPKIGARVLGASVYEIPPGTSLCPYHYECGEEEWLMVLSGTCTVRHPEGTDALKAGDVTCFVAGPEGAHKIINDTAEPIRILMLSTVRWPGITVYPDSDKVGAYIAPGENVIVRRSDTRDYYDGEV